MKKFIFCSFLILIFAAIAGAQAYEGSIEYDKKKQKALVINYAFSSEAVENAFKKKMETLGYKAKEEKGFLNKDKGFLLYKNAYITDISHDKMDYIIKVERKSRKSSDEAVLYVIINKDGANALEKLDAYDLRNAKSFLNNMIPDIEAANLELRIIAQEQSVAKAEKKLGELKDEQSSLEKKLKENKIAQDNTQKDIESQKQTLGTLIGTRRIN